MGWRMYGHRVGDVFSAEMFYVYLQLDAPMETRGWDHVIKHGGYSEVCHSLRGLKTIAIILIANYDFNGLKFWIDSAVWLT